MKLDPHNQVAGQDNGSEDMLQTHPPMLLGAKTVSQTGGQEGQEGPKSTSV